MALLPPLPLLGLLGLLLVLAGRPAAACLDNDGNEVDWWFTYKMSNSYSYAYADANTKSGGGMLQLVGELNDPSGKVALIQTLRALVKTRSSSNSSEANYTVTWNPYFMYNDQPDNAQPSSSYGHTKGVVGVGDRPFWLLHSTPNFPSSDGKGNFYFPEEEIIYGQTFLCVAFAPSLIDDMASQLLYTRPYVYVNLVSDAATAGHPTLDGFLKDPSWVTTPGTSVKKFGKFTHFAKNSQWDDDMYEYLVAPELKANLIVETWLRGKVVGSYCTGTDDGYKWTILDAENLVARSADGTNVTWKESQDHAKWAVSTDAAHPWVCIADINRMTSQRVRGGGAFCFENAILAAQLHSAIVKHADCKGPKPSDSCCYTKSTSCKAGQMCCTSAGDSLAESSCKGVYGAKHHCQWMSGKCIVGKARA